MIILYETYIVWYVFVVILLAFGLSLLIGISKDMAGAMISLPIVAMVGFVAGKVIYSDNVMFIPEYNWKYYFHIMF